MNYSLVEVYSFFEYINRKLKCEKKLIDVVHDSGLGTSKIISISCIESGGVDNFYLANKMLSIIYLKRDKGN